MHGHCSGACERIYLEKISMFDIYAEMLQNGDVAVVFLDIDGVLHPANAPGQDALGSTFEKEKMLLLKEICGNGKARIVLTSNWRKYPALKRIVNEEIVAAGIDGGVYDCTEVTRNGRQFEICRWLKNYEPKKFVIIDDLDLSDVESARPGNLWSDAGVYRHFVRTDYSVGLTRETTDDCITILDDLVWEGISYRSDDSEDNTSTLP